MKPFRGAVMVGIGAIFIIAIAGDAMWAQAPTSPVAVGERDPAPLVRIRIPAGSFRMGLAGRHASEDEQPVHRVTLRAFEIDRTEVTVAAYAQCVAEGACRASPPMIVSPDDLDPELSGLYAAACNAGRADRACHPMNCVDWEQANAYCSFRGGRLPTEAEWEYVARGPRSRRFPWGNHAPTVRHGNFADASGKRWVLAQGFARIWPLLTEEDDGYGTTAPVGSFPAGASPFGVLDLAGNVSEWVADWHGPYGAEAVTDPQGPESGEERGVRGSNWSSFSAPLSFLGGLRGAGAPSERGSLSGFRCAYDLEMLERSNH